MVKLHGSVVQAANANIQANWVSSADGDRNGACTVISNMTATAQQAYKPILDLSLYDDVTNPVAPSQGFTTHDPLLTDTNPYIDGDAPLIPNLVGGPATYGWCLSGYWNDGQEDPLFDTAFTLEYRVLEVADGTSVFEGYDQVVIRNTSAGTLQDVSIVIGANPPVLIDGVGGTLGELAPGETWTTTVLAGSYVTVPGGNSGEPEGPIAAFSGIPTAGPVELAVDFTDESLPGTSPITTWLWEFGDGATSPEQSPVHTYTSEGAFTVSLTVATAVGGDIETRTGYITVTPPVGPTAAFTGNPVSGTSDLTVQFADLSAPGTSPITSWFWEFGDGETSPLQSPSHTYTAAGAYDVTLTVTTAAGVDSDTKPAYVDVTAPTGPIAAFTFAPVVGTEDLTVQFADESIPGTSPIISWEWTFGDGDGSNEQSPAHTYLAAGTYDVSLTVTTAVGGDAEVKMGCVNVTAAAWPSAAFSGGPLTGPEDLTVQFGDQSTPGTSPIVSWEWTFGDSETSSEQSPSHTYTTPGLYSVSLTVTTAVGSDSESKPQYINVTAGGGPTALFSADPDQGVAPLTVQFTDMSVPGATSITSWLWSFGDGYTSMLQNPIHTYTAVGDYDVSLTVNSASGSNTTLVPNYIGVEPPPEEPVPVCGLAGLGVLAAACLLGGVIAARRKA